ncbi:hypothetical protein GCM10022628_01540 [Anoxybacillus suryakundensis]|uniref:ABC transporter n=1 Tax=Anoxybacillus suryakundensis TaxID=1325335 RepID=A0A0K6GNI3_9BACL|nr:ABC transporter [Anoxybacillus suryakundensis]
MIQIHDVSKRFGEFEAIKDVTFFVPKGSIYGLLGSNGAGKTTLDIPEVKIIRNIKQVPIYDWTPEMIEREKEKIIVHDKKKIEQCLQMADGGGGDYIVGIYYKNGHIDIQSFSKHLVPPFVD